MIKLTHLNNREFFINSDLILFLESTPDTLVIMTNGAKIMVKERVEEVVDRLVAFKRRFVDGETRVNIRHIEPPQPATREG